MDELESPSRKDSFDHVISIVLGSQFVEASPYRVASKPNGPYDLFGFVSNSSSRYSTLSSPEVAA